MMYSNISTRVGCFVVSLFIFNSHALSFSDQPAGASQPAPANNSTAPNTGTAPSNGNSPSNDSKPTNNGGAQTPGNSSNPSTGIATGKGDYIYLNVDTPGFVSIDDTATGSDQKTYCAPANTSLVVTDSDSTYYYVRLPGNGDFGIFKGDIHSKSPVTSVTKSSDGSTQTTSTTTDVPKCNKSYYPKQQESLAPNIVYKIPKTSLDAHDYDAAGIEYGLLVTPYKFHFSDKTIGASSSVGPYIGYHLITSPGSALSEILSVGVGNVPIATESTPAGNPKTSSQTSLSVAFGTVMTFTKSGTFQFALLGGFDWAGHSYQYSGKPWLGIGFGANLAK